MKIVRLNDHVGVSAQITPEDVADIAAAGYKVIVNNRPDGEDVEQPAGADIEAAAQACGLEYQHMPVASGGFPGADLAAMGRLLDDPARPLLAYCRTGTRCTNLWVASRDADARDAALATAQEKGFDVGMVARYISEN